MLLVIDTCNIGLGAEPGGGITLKIENIEGLPGVALLLPIVKESAEKLIKGAQQTMALKVVEVADNVAMKQAVRDAGA